MSRFVLGDELGNIKVLRYFPSRPQESKTDVKTVYNEESSQVVRSVQQLAASSAQDSVGQTTLATAFSDGSCALSLLKEDDTLSIPSRWKEPRIIGGKFIAITLNETAVYTCTSNGMLRKTPLPFKIDGEIIKTSETSCATLPSRLVDWRLSENCETFSYGGEEVDLSVWNTERAFQQTENSPCSNSVSKKRKRNDDLFPAEVWRARNVPNDNLGLRQPIRITALTYLQSSSTGYHLVTGTQFGDLRRYDTRASRRPVSNWSDLGKVGGIKVVETGFSENELFMGDGGSNLYSIDLRTGGILYGYQGISGAVTSIATSPTIIVSTALDRFARIHSLVSPPTIAGDHQERKGAVLEKSYFTSIPTVAIWDKRQFSMTYKEGTDEERDDDDVWDRLEDVAE